MECTCKFITTDCIVPGWGCCKCKVYNGLQRKECKRCGHVPEVKLPLPSEFGMCDVCGVVKGMEHVGHLEGQVQGGGERTVHTLADIRR